MSPVAAYFSIIILCFLIMFVCMTSVRHPAVFLDLPDSATSPDDHHTSTFYVYAEDETLTFKWLHAAVATAERLGIPEIKYISGHWVNGKLKTTRSIVMRVSDIN